MNGCEVVATFEDKYGDSRTIHRTRHGLKVRRETVTPAIAMSGPAGVLIGEKIRTMRKARGLSATELAFACGMGLGNPKQRILAIERPPSTRNKGITLGTLYVIAAALDCSPHDLIPSLEEVMEAARVAKNHSPITRAMLAI